MIETFDIAGYARISVDDEHDAKNTSIENQRAIIEDYVSHSFPGSKLTMYDDRDRSGYTFEQRESYQKMRKKLMAHKHEILIIKDFSRFSRRNGRGLVELEDLRDAGVRIISIGDGIDYPGGDDWLAIQLHFFINEMPVTDSSKKVRHVIKRRQQDGKWICAVPYGYVITNHKTMTFEIEESSADVVRLVFELYNNGMGYKSIANHLTELGIPTPRMMEKQRIEARGEECRLKTRPLWSIATIEGMLSNDFYIGTLRQGKYTRGKINGDDIKRDVSDHIVFENNHPAILDYRTFAQAQEQRKLRTKSHYRGVRINENAYSGFIFCGDCGSPMFAMSRRDLRPAYTCGSYHRRGLGGCTSHHTRVDILDSALKAYVQMVKDNASQMLDQLNRAITEESKHVKQNETVTENLDRLLEDAREELKATRRQKIREIMRTPEREAELEDSYGELEAELEDKIAGLRNQISLSQDRRNIILRTNRIAKTAMEIFDDVLNKDYLKRRDVDLIVDRITVFNDRIDIKLKADIDAILQSGQLAAVGSGDTANFQYDTEDIERAKEPLVLMAAQSSAHRPDKVFRVNVISEGEPLEIYTDAGGSVIFKKYSPTGELSGLAGHLCEASYKVSGRPMVVCDRDSIVAASGNARRELDGKPITADLDSAMQTRQLSRPQGAIPITATVPGADAALVAPIIVGGDLSGCVIFLSSETPPGDLEVKLAQTAAMFLAKQMED